MLISINQPAYLPWLGYFDRIVRSDLHVVLDHVQFEKNSFTNRNKILLNGNSLWLTIPLLTKGKFGGLNINTLEIDNKIKWQKKHWLSIQQAYSKFEPWNDFKDNLITIYENDYTKLNDVLNHSLNFFLKYMQISTPVQFSSNYSFIQTKSDLVLEICHKFGATKYLSGPLGRNYLDEKKFADTGIEIVYHDYSHPQYDQHSPKFVPYLSVLDLMACYGKKTLEVLKNV
jgi:hypothetical protein